VAAYGEQAINLLERILSNAHEPLATRLAVPNILARIGDQQAMDVLLEHLSDPDEAMRTQVLESVHRMRVRRPHLKIPLAQVRDVTVMETRNLYQQWYTLWDLGLDKENSLLLEAMQHRRSLTMKRIFRLLGCLYPVRSVDAVYKNLAAPTRRIRANAIEVLDNMLDKELKRFLIPLLDEALRENLAEVGEEAFGLSRQDRDKQLVALIEGQTAWLSSCAIFTTAQIKDQALTEEVRQSTQSDNPLIRETALAALRRLLSYQDLRQTAEQHLRDPSAKVRDYATWLVEGLQAQTE
jgi:HEAT repeat protein